MAKPTPEPRPATCPACFATSDAKAGEMCSGTESNCPIVNAGFHASYWPTQKEFDTRAGTPETPSGSLPVVTVTHGAAPGCTTDAYTHSSYVSETLSARQQALNDLEETIAELVEAEGETPSALSAEPRADVIRLVAMLTFSNYTSAADYEAKLQQAIERVTPYFETYAAILREKLSTAERERDKWKRELNIYRSAWLREIGGTIRAKHHEIDGFVLSTREIYEKSKRAEAAEAELARVKAALQKISDTQYIKLLAKDGYWDTYMPEGVKNIAEIALRTGGEPKEGQGH